MSSSEPAEPPVVDIVIPVYNEAHVLPRSIGRLCDYLRAEFPFTWRVTIADNASTDDTFAIATELGRQYPGVAVLHLDQKGKGRAIRTAWMASDATVVAYMDVDLSTGLSALLPLVAPLLSRHSDVAIGSRLISTAAVARGPRREFVSRTYNLIMRMLFLNRFHDAQCGFKAARRDVAQLLVPHVQDDTWFFDAELLLLAEHNGLRVQEVPVDWIDDPDSRVNIRSTAGQDVKGMIRMLRTFLRGGGRIDLGEHARPGLVDDFGRQFVGFLFVGLISTLANLLLFLALRTSTGAIAANLVAHTSVTLVNVWANRRYTFGQRGRADRSRQYVGAFVSWLLGALVSTAALTAVVVAKGSVTVEVLVLLAAWSAMAVVRLGLLRSWLFRTRSAPIGVERTDINPPTG